MPIWKHVRAVLLLPFMVTIVIPAMLVWFTGSDTLELADLAPGWLLVLLVVGIALMIIGGVMLAQTVRLFVTVGAGTLAPWDPTQRLVAVGIYRHVRNPMITGVLSILLGESLAFASVPMFIWFGLFAVANAIYIPWHEEPGLVKRFGDDYLEYRRHVPRWIPRWSPWPDKMRDP